MTINGDTTNAKTSTITTVPNDPDAATSTMSTAGLIVLDATTTVDAEVFDAYSNPILTEGPIVLVVTGHDTNLYFTYALQATNSY